MAEQGQLLRGAISGPDLERSRGIPCMSYGQDSLLCKAIPYRIIISSWEFDHGSYEFGLLSWFGGSQGNDVSACPTVVLASKGCCLI